MNASSLNTGKALPPNRLGAQARLRALQAGIIELILERELEPGEPLPTETELAAALGIGRNTLREALKVLQALGVIEIRHGFGMFVAGSSFEALADGLTFRARLSLRHRGQEALELVEVRRVLETALIGGAVTLMTRDQLAGLGDAVRRLEASAGSAEHFADADAEFHRRLFEPLDNGMLLELVGVFRTVYRRLQREVGNDVDLAAEAALHQGIYEAVAAGDGTLAAERLGRHFDGLRRKITALAGE